MKIFAGSDHAGFDLKNALVKHLQAAGHLVVDLGPGTAASTDYPDYAGRVAEAVVDDPNGARGLLVCGSGIGVSIVANKIPGIRAVDAWDDESARISRAHNDTNILCLGARSVTEPQAVSITKTWLTTGFDGGRHARRVNKISGVQHAGEIHAAVRKELANLKAVNAINRIWAHDATVFTPEAGTDPATRLSIESRLGWLHAPDAMPAHIGAIQALGADVATLGLTDVLILGTGGSALGAEVLAGTLGPKTGGLRLHVLDNTDPAAVAAIESQLPLSQTLFIVASKSDNCLQVESFERHFWTTAKTALGAQRARLQFCAIADAGTKLDDRASMQYAHVFHSDPQIGGRFSVLSLFGLVPAGLLGADLRCFIELGAQMADACRIPEPAANPGAQLGAWLAATAKRGRNKLTLLASLELAGLGPWIESLVAESTGKQGKGLVPVQGEQLGDPDSYGDDRCFVVLQLANGGAAAPASFLESLATLGHPILTLTVANPEAIAGEFFRWEFATAVAGALMNLNPFDEPDVAAAKDATRRALEDFARLGALPPTSLPAAAPTDLAALSSLLDTLRPGEYISLCPFFQQTDARDAALLSLRNLLRQHTHAATTVGYGPRSLHTTGQLHHGGPNEGLFLQLTADAPRASPIPGLGFDFATLRDAQSLGDFETLRSARRRVLRVHLGADIEGGLHQLESTLAAWTSSSKRHSAKGPQS